MYKKYLFFLLFLIAPFSSILAMQDNSKILSVLDTLPISATDQIKLGNYCMRDARDNKNEAVKKDLVRRAANEYELVYRDTKNDATLRSIARSHLEGIYSRYPEFKLQRSLKLFVAEDEKNPVIIPEHNWIPNYFPKRNYHEDIVIPAADRIKSGNNYMRNARANTKSESEKKDLIRQAANEYELVYRDPTNDAFLRSTARTNLEAIYSRYQDFRLQQTLRLFAAEDTRNPLVISENNNNSHNVHSQENNHDEKRIDKYFRSPDHRTLFSERVFGEELAIIREEKVAKEKADQEAQQKAEQEAQEKVKKEKIEKERAAQKKAAKEKAESKKEKTKKENFSLDEALLTVLKQQISRKEFDKSTQTCWEIFQKGQTQARAIARQQLQMLAETNKSHDAFYYLALSYKNDPDTMIGLFLKAENQRSQAPSLAMSLAVQEIQALPKNNPRALHALSTHYYHQSKVLPAARISSLRLAAGYAKQLHDLQKTFEGPINYPFLLSELGSTLRDKALQTVRSKLIAAIIELPQDLNESENFFRCARDIQTYKGKSSSKNRALETAVIDYNLGQVQELRFRHLQEMGKLDEALDSYISAMNGGSSDAAKQIETLLVEGIDGFPLGCSHRTMLLDLLRKHHPNSELFSKKDFKESPYCTTAKKIIEQEKLIIPKTKFEGRKETIMKYYEGLFWYDRKDTKQSTDLMRPCTDYSPANLFMVNALLAEKMEQGDIKAAREEIESDWRLIPDLPFPRGPLLLSSTLIALDTLIDKGDIDSMYSALCGFLTAHIPHNQNTVIRVCELLNMTEELLAQNPNHSCQETLVGDNFISNLLSFAELSKDPEPLHIVAGHVLARLKRSPNNKQTLDLIKLLSAITETLNDNLRKTNRTSSSLQSDTTEILVKKIDLMLATDQEKSYCSSLKMLRSVLQGIPQDLQTTIVSKNPPILLVSIDQFYAQKIDRISRGIQESNDVEIMSALRSLLSQFRITNTLEQYKLLRNKNNIMQSLENYAASKQIKNSSDFQAMIGFKLMLTIDKSLIDSNYSLDNALEELCITFPVVGPTILAREFVTNTLLAPNKSRAKALITRAYQNASKEGMEDIALIKINEQIVNSMSV